MKVRIKGKIIILSESPTKDVPAAIMVKSEELISEKCLGWIFCDVLKGQKHYELPAEITRMDKVNVYLRVI